MAKTSASHNGLVSAPELGEWLNLTPRRIQQLVHEGVLERAARGRYPLKSCVQAYTRYQDGQIMRTGSSGELSDEKLRMARLERRRKELEFERLQGELITVEHHERVMADVLAMVRRNVRNLPGTLSQRLAGLDEPRDVNRILGPALDNALRSIVAEGERLGQEALPDEVPGRAALIEGGVTTISELMSHPDLTLIDGIGPKTAQKLRVFMADR